MASAPDFERLVARHRAQVFGAALARCGDRVLAEDVVQEAFLHAWQDMASLRDPEKIAAWISGIAVNLAASAVRTRARRMRLAPRHDEVLDGLPRAVGPDELLSRAQLSQRVRNAVAELPASYRDPVTAFYVEERSVQQIADRAKTSAASVKQRLSRGRRLLRSSLASVGAALLAVGRHARASSQLQKVGFLVSVKQVAFVACIAIALVSAFLGFRTGDRDVHERSFVSVSLPGAIAATKDSPPASRTAGQPVTVTRLGTEAERVALRQALASARSRREAAPRSEVSTMQSGDELDEGYVRAAVREVAPLVQACFETGLIRGARGDGDVVVHFKIEGEAGVGAAVTETAVDDTSTLADPEVRDCIRDTMFALQLGAPPRGGEIDVRKRFSFRLVGPPPDTIPTSGTWGSAEGS
jgi:RNA polymerase sigma factor (sigma-70 family)